MTLRGGLPHFLESNSNFLRLVTFDGYELNLTKLILSIKIQSFMYVLVSKFRFLVFRLLLSRVAPYYSALLGTFWLVWRISFILSNSLRDFPDSAESTFSCVDFIEITKTNDLHNLEKSSFDVCLASNIQDFTRGKININIKSTF